MKLFKRTIFSVFCFTSLIAGDLSAGNIANQLSIFTKETKIYRGYPVGSIVINLPLGNYTFPNGRTISFTIGLGSGLFNHLKESPYKFYFVTDRGPNIDCEEDVAIIGADLCRTGKIFPFPTYTPTIYEIVIFPNGKWRILREIPLKDSAGRPITGLPNPLPSTEFAFDGQGRPLPFDPNGLDVEAIVRLSNGTFILGEEYGTSIVFVDRDGRIIRRLVPKGLGPYYANATYRIEEKLPAILARRTLNRGIEGIALSPDETKLYFILQSPLSNPDRDAYRNSRLVRLFEFDLRKDEVTAEYVYQLDRPETFKLDNSTRQSDVRVSELFALPDGSLVVLERIDKTTKFYRLTLDPNKNILGSKYDDPQNLDSLERVGIDPSFLLHKELIFSSEWMPQLPEKLEGLVIRNGVLIVVNDNDFGLQPSPTTLTILPLKSIQR